VLFAAFVSLFLGAGLVSGSMIPVGLLSEIAAAEAVAPETPAPEDAVAAVRAAAHPVAEAIDPQIASELAVPDQAQGEWPPYPPLFSRGYLLGGWCYIECSNGTFTSVRSSGTSACCDACVNFCGDGCVAEGGGPSVICG
jgi:hypothetical protein